LHPFCGRLDKKDGVMAGRDPPVEVFFQIKKNHTHNFADPARSSGETL